MGPAGFAVGREKKRSQGVKNDPRVLNQLSCEEGGAMMQDGEVVGMTFRSLTLNM